MAQRFAEHGKRSTIANVAVLADLQSCAVDDRGGRAEGEAAAAAIEATRHLINHGHRKIAYLGVEPVTPTAQGRQRGFADAMAAAGLSEISLQVDGLRSEQQSYTAVDGLMRMDNPPTALFASHHLVTLGAIRALHDLRLEDQ